MILTLSLAAGAAALVWSGGFWIGRQRAAATGDDTPALLAAAVRIAEARTYQALSRARAAEEQVAELRPRFEHGVVELQRLRVGLAHAEGSRITAEEALGVAREAAQAAREDAQAAREDAQAARADAQAARADAQAARADAQAARTRLRAAEAALSQSAGAGLDADRLKQLITEAVASAADPLGPALANLEIGRSRRDLGGLLGAMAAAGGFDAVLLSDTGGLLLAASHDSLQSEIRAGVSSLLVNLAEQLVRAGEAEPVAFALHDTAGRVAISRLFRVAGERFLLTALSAGRPVAATALDPALRHLERLMDDWTRGPDGGPWDPV